VSASFNRWIRAVALAVVVGLSSVDAPPALCQEGAGQPGVVLGRVLDAESGQPVERVEIRLVGDAEDLVQFTDGAGRFLFPRVQPGVYEVLLTHLAYGSQTDRIEVGTGERVSYEVRLAMEPIELAPLAVTVERRRISPRHLGFYGRLSLGMGGYFITREDIERRQPLRTAHMIDELPGVDIHPINAFEYHVWFSRYGRGCLPPVYVDGMFWEQGIVGLQPVEVEAIEVYDGPASVPAEFGGSRAGCGVVVIWTRRGTGEEVANTWEADTSIWNTLAVAAVAVPCLIVGLVVLF
jgi:hypothetical protein